MSQQYVKDEYPLSDMTARMIAAATEVHRTLDPGFEEVIYQRALAVELPAHDLEFSREVWMDVTYKGVKVGRKRVDFHPLRRLRITLVTILGRQGGSLRLKSATQPSQGFPLQAQSYLKASGYKVGLLLNFGAKKLQIKRLAN